MTDAEKYQPWMMIEVAKYEKLLEFVKRAQQSSCCLVCNCLPCEATKILREIGEL